MKYKIGFLDSGCGSLIFATDVYRNIANQLQAISSQTGIEFEFYQIGDVKNYPYSSKSADEVKKLTKNSIDFLQKEGLNLIVIACNTSLINGDNFSECNKKNSSIISILEISAKSLYDAALRSAANNQLHIAVFATTATINSRFYETKLKEIHNSSAKKNCEIFIHNFAPQNWVSLIENNEEESISNQTVCDDLEDFKTKVGINFNKISAIGLFCTHYPLFLPQIQQFFKQNNLESPIISQGKILSNAILEKIEKDLKIKNINHKNHNPKPIKIKSFVTGNSTEGIRSSAKKFASDLLDVIEFQAIS